MLPLHASMVEFTTFLGPVLRAMTGRRTQRSSAPRPMLPQESLFTNWRAAHHYDWNHDRGVLLSGPPPMMRGKKVWLLLAERTDSVERTP